MPQTTEQLAGYYQFLLDKHLDEVCQETLAGLRQFDTPLLQLLFKNPEAQAMAWLKGREQEFLENGARGDAMAYDRERLALWETTGVPGIPVSAQDATDMFLFHLAHRRALQKFVVRFARTSAAKIALFEEIERHYEVVLPLARQAMVRFSTLSRQA